MSKKQKLKAIHIWSIYILLPLLANGFAAFFVVTISPILYTPEQNIQFAEFVQKYPLVYITSIISPFILVFGFLIFYSKSIINRINFQNTDSLPLDKNLTARILNAPIIVIFCTVVGWVFASFETSVLSLIFDKTFNLKRFSQSTLANLATGSVATMIGYYVCDRFLKKKIIPLIVPHGKLLEIKKLMYLNIQRKFIIFFFSICVSPILILGSGLIFKDLQVSQLTSESHLTYIFFAIGYFILSGIFLTLMLSKDFHDPLVAMKKATSKIKRSDFSVSLPIEANDEFGQLASSINSMANELAEKEIIKETFGKAVDPRIRDFLLQNNQNWGGEENYAVVLFTDIRSFTALAESLPASEVVKLLNRYFEEMSLCIETHNGIINKYIGDAIMAVFGTPLLIENPEEQAVKAALAMRGSLAQLNNEFEAEGLPALKTGIGIHAGRLMAGKMGAKSRMEYTVIGDTVNQASRIESACKSLQKEILISESVYRKLTDDTQKLCTRAGKVKVKGKTELILLYHI